MTEAGPNVGTEHAGQVSSGLVIHVDTSNEERGVPCPELVSCQFSLWKRFTGLLIASRLWLVGPTSVARAGIGSDAGWKE